MRTSFRATFPTLKKGCATGLVQLHFVDDVFAQALVSSVNGLMDEKEDESQCRIGQSALVVSLNGNTSEGSGQRQPKR
ncbi:MAG TPA: hypothetical protein VIP57_13500 [Candidatus Dormibacteraeota bacterium]